MIVRKASFNLFLEIMPEALEGGEDDTDDRHINDNVRLDGLLMLLIFSQTFDKCTWHIS